MKLDCITVTKILGASEKADVGNEETDLRIKNLLSWQIILNIRQIASDIEEKLPNQGEVHREVRRIYLSYLPFLYLTIEFNFRTALEK